MKNLLIAALLLSPLTVSAQGFDLNSVSADAVAAYAEKAAPQALPEASKDGLKDWTVMVFMNAKNNLDDSMLYGISGKWAQKDMKEMQKVGTTGKVNVLLEYGMSGQGSKRVRVEKDGETLFSADPNGDMGDYKRVIDFVKWAKTEYPAKRYMLVLWNHGLGWIDPVMHNYADGSVPTSKGILFDDETKNYVRTRQLGEILRQAGYVDVFVQNACLQQMAEVLYEMKDNVGLFVGSEETMLAQGFDYTGLLNFMNANPAFTHEQLGEYLVTWYKAFYAAGMNVGPISVPLGDMGATLSLVRPAALNDLPGYLDAFAGAVMRNNETDAAKYAIENVIRLTSLDPKNDKKKLIAAYADLYDFAFRVAVKSQSQETKAAADSLMAFIKNGLVLRSVGLNGDKENGYDYTKVGGIAINTTMKIKTVPAQLEAIFETKYADLSLSKASQWDEFLAWSDGVWRK